MKVTQISSFFNFTPPTFMAKLFYGLLSIFVVVMIVSFIMSFLKSRHKY